MLSSVLYALCITLVYAKDKPIVFQFEPESVVETLKSLMSSKYLKTLVDEFAVKAAEQFIKEIEKKQKGLISTTERYDSGPSVSLFDAPNKKKPLWPSLGREAPSIPSIENGDQGSPSADVENKYSNEDGYQRGISPFRKIDHNSFEDSERDKLLALIETPHPDGDNLEEEITLTDLESSEQKRIEKPRKIFKINGKNYRAYDFDWN